MNNSKSALQQTIQCMACCIFLIPYVSCVSKKSTATAQLRAVELTSTFPMPTPAGQVEYSVDRLTQFEWQNKIVQKITVTRNLSVLKRNDAGEVIGNDLISLPDGSRYFFYRIGETHGIFYDTAKTAPKVFSRVLVDSMLRLNTSTSFGEVMKTKMSNTRLVSSEFSADKTHLTERYVSTSKIDLSYSDSTILTYAKPLNDVYFSFSKELDSTKKMKLSKIELKYNAIPNSPETYRRVSRQVTFEIQETSKYNRDSIIAIFNTLDSVTKKQNVL